MANEMLLAAARRGELGNTPDQIMARMTAFYVDQGLSPGEAQAQARDTMGLLRDTFGRRDDVQDRAMQLVRDAEKRAFYRANPGALADGASAPSADSFPGYDPTAGPLSGPPERPRLSSPLTKAQTDDMRVTRPMPPNPMVAWLRPKDAPPARQMSPYPPIGETIFRPQSLAEARAYNEQRIKDDAYRAAASGPQQVRVPSGQAPETLGAEPYRPPQPASPPGQSAPSIVASASAAPGQSPAPMDRALDRAAGLPDDALGGWASPTAALATARRAAASPLASAPLPPPRPRDEAPVMRGDYQSMNALADGPERFMPARVMQGDRVNWGDNDSAADFFNADRALMSMGRSGGGRVDLMQMAREALNTQMARRHSEEALKAMLRPKPAQRAEGGRAEGRGGGNDKVFEHAMAILRHLITKGA